MDRPRARLEPAKYVSTTMSANRTLKERWYNGFKLALFATVLFSLVGIPFQLLDWGVGHVLEGQDCGTVAMGVSIYLLVCLLAYPILFDWMAAVFRIQFVHKSIRLPARAPKPEPPSKPGETVRSPDRR